MVKLIQPPDLPALKRFVNLLSEEDRRFFNFFDRNQLKRALDLQAYVWRDGVDGEEIIAYGHIERFPEKIKRHVGRLGIAVAKEHRGTGLSKKVMEHLLQAARHDGLSKLWLSVHVDNARAISLYESFGFKAEGLFLDEERKGYATSDILSMALHLHDPGKEGIPWSQPDIGTDEFMAVWRTLHSGWLTQGPRTAELERQLAIKSDSKYAVAFNNATSALMAAFALSFKPGDQVVFPSYTFVSTLNSAIIHGIKPVLVDVEPGTGNIDIQALQRVLAGNDQIRGIAPVDIAGHSVDMGCLDSFARAYNLKIVRDAAEAVGARAFGRGIGGWDHPAILSFHAAKNLTTIEGGAVLTNDREFAEELRIFRSHGESPKVKFQWDSFGLNLRLTDLQAAIGLAQLGKLDKYVANRNHIMRFYKKELSGILKFQEVKQYVDVHPYMMAMGRAEPRKLQEIVSALNIAGIGYRRSWQPLHMQPAFAGQFEDQRYPISEQIAERTICLPLYNGMTMKEAEKIVKVLKDDL